MGLNLQRARLIIMTSAALMEGAVVAYAGPIGFLDIAIPHLARRLFATSDHRILVPGSILIGIVLALACGILAEMPGSSLTLPINAATSLFGAPIALWVLLRARRGGWL
jgi:iron complex transport system permease protein